MWNSCSRASPMMPKKFCSKTVLSKCKQDKPLWLQVNIQKGGAPVLSISRTQTFKPQHWFCFQNLRCYSKKRCPVNYKWFKFPWDNSGAKTLTPDTKHQWLQRKLARGSVPQMGRLWSICSMLVATCSPPTCRTANLPLSGTIPHGYRSIQDDRDVAEVLHARALPKTNFKRPLTVNNSRPKANQQFTAKLLAGSIKQFQLLFQRRATQVVRVLNVRAGTK